MENTCALSTISASTAPAVTSAESSWRGRWWPRSERPTTQHALCARSASKSSRTLCHWHRGLRYVLKMVVYFMTHRRPFPAGDRVTFNGKDCLCQYCAQPTSPGPTKDITGPSSESSHSYLWTTIDGHMPSHDTDQVYIIVLKLMDFNCASEYEFCYIASVFLTLICFCFCVIVLDCAGCGRDIKNGQALLALERQWHLGCFKCKACAKVLTGEYISK